MKIIGLLGGMSWESSIEYYRLANKMINQQLGGLHSAKVILYSVDFAPLEQWMRNDEWQLILHELIEASKHLEIAGANFILICTNTMHKLVDQIQAHINIPIFHIADAAALQIKELNLKKVGLLGTRFTMEGDFYRKRLKDHHSIDVIIPDQEDRDEVNRIIFEELVQGKIFDASRKVYQNIIEKLQLAGAEGVILGCTEIPLLISADNSPIPVFDTTTLHMDYAVKKTLE